MILATCRNNRSGYEGTLKEGHEYEVTDIVPSIFAGAYYISVIGEYGEEAICHLDRFDVSRAEACEWIRHAEDEQEAA